MRNIVIAIFISLASGCNNQATYEAVQQGQRNECAKLPQGRYEDCIREIGVSYGEYERERLELIKAEDQ